MEQKQKKTVKPQSPGLRERAVRLVLECRKTGVINQIGPWKSMREIEWETLEWVDWYDSRCLLAPIRCREAMLAGPRGDTSPPQKAEKAFHANLSTLDMVS